MSKMNEQPEENQNNDGEENRYNQSDKPKQQPQHDLNKAGIEQDTSALYLTSESTLQSPAEFKTDKEGDHSNEDEEITVSGNSDTTMPPTMAGDQSIALDGDDDATDLNKGLDEQDIEKY